MQRAATGQGNGDEDRQVDERSQPLHAHETIKVYRGLMIVGAQTSLLIRPAGLLDRLLSYEAPRPVGQRIYSVLLQRRSLKSALVSC